VYGDGFRDECTPIQRSGVERAVGFTKPPYLICLYDNLDCAIPDIYGAGWVLYGTHMPVEDPDRLADGICGVGPADGRTYQAMRVVDIEGRDGCMNPDGHYGITWWASTGVSSWLLSPVTQLTHLKGENCDDRVVRRVTGTGTTGCRPVPAGARALTAYSIGVRIRVYENSGCSDAEGDGYSYAYGGTPLRDGACFRAFSGGPWRSYRIEARR